MNSLLRKQLFKEFNINSLKKQNITNFLNINKQYPTSTAIRLQTIRGPLKQISINKNNLFFTLNYKTFFSKGDKAKEKEAAKKEEEKKEEEHHQEDKPKKGEEQKKSEEKKQNKENTSDEESEEKKITAQKYKELKELYSEQSHKMEALRKKFEEVRSLYLDNVSETEQIKVRYDREIANTKEFAISKFAKDLLEVHDNFDRALSMVHEKDFTKLTDEEQEEIYNSFVEGKINTIYKFN
jgi:molecular chaperone GrpE (heat shock protein)